MSWNSEQKQAVLLDNNSLSPTYYDGPFGRVPEFFHSEFITSDAQAADVAAARLARQLGTTQSISFGSIVNPRLEPSQVVRVSRLRAGIDQEDHVIETLTIPLGAEQEMTGQTREASQRAMSARLNSSGEFATSATPEPSGPPRRAWPAARAPPRRVA